ncbi:NAD(P)-dependent oxidoreductase [Methylobacterium sp. NEAU 140]|uniref:NAD(P)-dependent oxidoreductase n=1 Tax=Methylobacterium sp. NEAU 140 TaxID=3064945 RepID=UPI00273721CF|nr:NAD(P)-dependent oxidoreductase [Methylobacterium sp. NEAU 140]MDP4024626.1 NAD(P)-dependent oxidoreductase [Methylobacterium sp. NEAU 140]
MARTTPGTTTLGFIGLGMMGAPMARRLAEAGHALALHDADPARTRALCADLGAGPLSREAAARLDGLITMLPNSAVVEDVLLGRGWADALPRGATVIDMSSSEPVRSRDLGARLAERGLGYLDAPVSGGVTRAADGTLAILVGGEAALIARWRPVLGAMGRSILHIGGAGAGHAAKALNNYVSAAGLMATVEALHVAERFGIAPETMTDVLNASTGRSNTSENKVKPFMLSGTFGSGFALRLMDKDLGIAGDLADAVGYPLTFGRHCIAVWHAVAVEAGPATDHTEMYRLLGKA